MPDPRKSVFTGHEDEIVSLFKKGASQADIARRFNTTNENVWLWLGRHPEFLEHYQGKKGLNYQSKKGLNNKSKKGLNSKSKKGFTERSYKLDPDADQIIEHLKNGKSYHEIADLLGVSYSTLKDWLKRHPEIKQLYSRKKKRILDQHVETIVELLKQGNSYTAIAKKLNISNQTVGRWMAKHPDIAQQYSFNRYSGIKSIFDDNRDLIIELLDQGRSYTYISLYIGSNPTSLRLWLNKHPEVHTHYSIKPKAGGLSTCDDNTDLITELLDQGRSISYISLHIGSNLSTLSRWLNKHPEIKERYSYDARKNYYFLRDRSKANS
ncbi:MAG: helix-turn-helix domain-containing protein [Coriobacteriales bacterium]|jgi:DNA invertase Pin-like site-specific DNA recombinase|nr:helix-turn-helix domain-containing protein [Coriobacteriales bacterium]